MAAKRPGLQPVFQLPREIRAVFEPAQDILMRITGVTTGMLGALSTFDADPLPSGAVLADVITRVNALQTTLNDTIAKLNEVISRIQED